MKEVFLILFIILQGLDIYTTAIVLKNGGRELNPLLAWLFEKFNPIASMVIVKAIAIYAAVYIDDLYANIIFCALYIWVVLNNFEVISDQKNGK